MTPEFLKWFADTYPLMAEAAIKGESGPHGDRSNAWAGWQGAHSSLGINVDLPPTPPPMRDGLGRAVPPTTEYRRPEPSSYDFGMMVFVAVCVGFGFISGYIARGGAL